MQQQALIEKFISTLPTETNNTKKLFAIGFVGLNGVGKSFVAQKISEKLGLYIGSNDKIRRFLNENGIEGANPAQEMVFMIGPASSKYLYENKISHIIDADLMQFSDITKKNAEAYGAHVYLVKLICPENIILERLKKRSEDVQKNPTLNFSRVGEDEYFARKTLHKSLSPPEIFFTIDTSLDVNRQVDDLIKKLKKEQVI